MTHPAHPLTERAGDSYFQYHDLEAGKRIARRERTVHEFPNKVGKYCVLLCDGPDDCPDPRTTQETWFCPETAEWGVGDTPEEAWRFVLGAFFGPADDGYDERWLITMLQVV